jgi:hypothetical protein
VRAFLGVKICNYSLPKFLIAKTFSFALNFEEKSEENAEHTSVCEQFSSDFSSKFSQKWTFASRVEQLQFIHAT